MTSKDSTGSFPVDVFGCGLLGVLDIGDDLVRLQAGLDADVEDDGGEDSADQLAPSEREHAHRTFAIVAQQAEHGQAAEPQDHPPAGLELQRRDLAAVAERSADRGPRSPEPSRGTASSSCPTRSRRR